MRHQYQQIAFTPAVKAAQESYGSRDAYARHAAKPFDADAGLSREEAGFLTEQDGFFLATVSETGWPYVQYRGGPKGVLKALGPRRVGWADFAGNRQYITVGNAAADNRVSIIVMDYARQARLKIFGYANICRADDAPELAAALVVDGYHAKVERVVTVEVAAFDWNCPQHIVPRYTGDEVARVIAPLKERIAELEAKVRAG